MIDLYFWPTGNGKKIVILLEELGLPYTIKPINIGRGDQLAPEFLKISPNGRMPAIVDDEPMGGGAPISIFESGPIMMYLAEKTGRFSPQDPRGKYDVAQWVGWQLAREMNWVGFNYARDFTLPGQQDGPIGFLMYPYAETTQGHKDSLDPDTFSYRITSQEVA
jgi:glutathione S-transferase